MISWSNRGYQTGRPNKYIELQKQLKRKNITLEELDQIESELMVEYIQLPGRQHVTNRILDYCTQTVNENTETIQKIQVALGEPLREVFYISKETRGEIWEFAQECHSNRLKMLTDPQNRNKYQRMQNVVDFNNELNEGVIDERKQSSIANKEIDRRRNHILSMVLKSQKKFEGETKVNKELKTKLDRVEQIYQPKNAARSERAQLLFDTIKTSESSNKRNEDTRRELKLKILSNLRRLLMKRRNQILGIESEVNIEPAPSRSVERTTTVTRSGKFNIEILEDELAHIGNPTIFPRTRRIKSFGGSVESSLMTEPLADKSVEFLTDLEASLKIPNNVTNKKSRYRRDRSARDRIDGRNLIPELKVAEPSEDKILPTVPGKHTLKVNKALSKLKTVSLNPLPQNTAESQINPILSTIPSVHHASDIAMRDAVFHDDSSAPIIGVPLTYDASYASSDQSDIRDTEHITHGESHDRSIEKRLDILSKKDGIIQTKSKIQKGVTPTNYHPSKSIDRSDSQGVPSKLYEQSRDNSVQPRALKSTIGRIFETTNSKHQASNMSSDHQYASHLDKTYQSTAHTVNEIELLAQDIRHDRQALNNSLNKVYRNSRDAFTMITFDQANDKQTICTEETDIRDPESNQPSLKLYRGYIKERNMENMKDRAEYTGETSNKLEAQARRNQLSKKLFNRLRQTKILSHGFNKIINSNSVKY